MHECIANIAPYGVSPLVRIPDKERWMIKRALDAGAHGIMTPLLSTVDEVEEVVKQVRPFLFCCCCSLCYTLGCCVAGLVRLICVSPSFRRVGREDLEVLSQ